MRELKFDERSHQYTVGDKILISVTQLVGKYKKPFDAEYWANRKATERGVTPQEIKAEWKQKADDSSKLGNNVHLFMQCHGLKKQGKSEEDIKQILIKQNKTTQDLKPINIQAERRMSVGEKFWADHSHLIPMTGEMQVYDWEHLIAGTIDQPVKCDEGFYYLIDWKTNKEIETVSIYGNKMLPPVNHLDDCHFNQYSLQLSLYKYILEHNYNIIIKGLYIIHLRAKDYVQYECPYLETEVQSILQCRKQEITL